MMACVQLLHDATEFKSFHCLSVSFSLLATVVHQTGSTSQQTISTCVLPHVNIARTFQGASPEKRWFVADNHFTSSYPFYHAFHSYWLFVLMDAQSISLEIFKYSDGQADGVACADLDF